MTKNGMVGFLLLFAISWQGYAQVGFDYEKKYYKPSKSVKLNAKKEALEWLEFYADTIGIPKDIELGKLVYRPNEATFSILDDIDFEERKPTPEEIKEGIEHAESMEMYNYRCEYRVGKQNLGIYFAFNAHGELLGVHVYDNNKGNRCYYYRWFDKKVFQYY